MDVPISIGIVLALAMSVAETIHHAEHAYFDAALMLLAFLLAGPLSRSKHASQDAGGRPEISPHSRGETATEVRRRR
jgi:cation transport ATPase